eukprot:CAMPEP_0184689972 /NCGR_PEP_ID=MMETSP0312-20130426/30951_1 /TAXON_ID=31354 /ORGANISM="Compsopogon coeruleus, Strain SAG 36.94" /LENGTH=40 /DNA_ID= /DNA_START= /DNA_END= /DNA_ORIENTATION=
MTFNSDIGKPPPLVPSEKRVSRYRATEQWNEEVQHMKNLE